MIQFGNFIIRNEAVDGNFYFYRMKIYLIWISGKLIGGIPFNKSAFSSLSECPIIPDEFTINEGETYLSSIDKFLNDRVLQKSIKKVENSAKKI